MKQVFQNPLEKNGKKFHCEICDYFTSNKKDYDKHLSTPKHKKRDFETNETNLKQKNPLIIICECGETFHSRTSLWRHTKSCNFIDEKNPLTIICECGETFHSRTSVWRHKKSCNFIDEKIPKKSPTDLTQEMVMELIQDNKEMKQVILEQTNALTNLIKSGVMSNSNNFYSNNKTFNLNFFLNETCKNAMNITEFVESIELQLSDLENVGEVGYIEGISNIITSNLKALDVTQRPIHCTDKKRDILYIKDENKWEKDEDNHKIRRVIQKVACKNTKLLSEFKKKYPECNDSSSKCSDKYNKIIIESMGGLGSNEEEKQDKIIRNISKNVTIDKI